MKPRTVILAIAAFVAVFVVLAWLQMRTAGRLEAIEARLEAIETNQTDYHFHNRRQLQQIEAETTLLRSAIMER